MHEKKNCDLHVCARATNLCACLRVMCVRERVCVWYVCVNVCASVFVCVLAYVRKCVCVCLSVCLSICLSVGVE